MIPHRKNPKTTKQSKQEPDPGTQENWNDQTPRMLPEALRVPGDTADSIADLNLKKAGEAVLFLDQVKTDMKTTGKAVCGIGLDATCNDDTGPLTIGRFELIRPIGEGGFAKVFLAHDPFLNREVALKVPKPAALMSEESRIRFEREAQTSALLAHPNIASVFEAGSVGPLTYIATEYCPGQNLSQWFNDCEKTIDQQTAAKLVATLAESAHHAHQRGIIHRDLKPANVLIARESDEDGSVSCADDLASRLRITDFGLARQLESGANSLTTEGAVVGTPAYMSPEQARGDSDVSATGDIFSLGVILHELLTGETPFLKSTHLDTLRAVEGQQVSKLRRPREKVARDLEAICLKCLQKNKSDRYPSAFALSDDLRSWIAGRPVAARLPSPLERSIKWCKRNPLLATAFASVLIALGFALFQWNSSIHNLARANEETDRANQEAERANLEAERANDEAIRANRNIELAQETVAQMASHIAGSSRIPVDFRAKILSRAINLQEQLLADDPNNSKVILETANVYKLEAMAHRETLDYAKGLISMERACSIMEMFDREKWTREQKTDWLSIQYMRAQMLIGLDRTDEAKEIHAKLRAFTNEPLRTAFVICKQAEMLFEEGRFREAWLENRNAMLVLEASFGFNEKSTKTSSKERLHSHGNRFDFLVVGQRVDMLHVICRCELAMEQFEDAETTAVHAIELMQQLKSAIPMHESCVNMESGLYRLRAHACRKLGSEIKSTEYLRKALTIVQSLKSSFKTRRLKVKGIVYRAELVEQLISTGNWGDAFVELDLADAALDELGAPVSKPENKSQESEKNDMRVGVVELLEAVQKLKTELPKREKRLRELSLKFYSYLKEHYPKHEQVGLLQHVVDE
jgi:tetratricopeptide (TPR) repeat protein